MRLKNIFIIFSIFIISSYNKAQTSMNIYEKIIPVPQIIEIQKGELAIGKINKIILPRGIDERIIKAANNFSESFRLKYGKKLNLDYNLSKDNAIELIVNPKFLIPNVSERILDQSYELSIIPSKISIIAKSEQGLFYGLKSLEQIIFLADTKTLPCVKIVDYPNMEWRGISDDISRGQVSTLENFKKIISFLARYKMNIYMPYIEDVFTFDAYPEIGKNRGALTKKEAAEIVKYAHENFIEVIPIFQTLGHYENILSLPEYLKLAEFPGAASLNVSSPEIYKFLETAFDELFEVFPSEYFHIGADESYDVALGESSFLLDSLSLAEIHLRHYLKVYEICSKKNKKVLIYSDMLLHHQEVLDRLPKDIIIVDWHYRPQNFYESTKLFNQKGFKYLVSPSVWNFTSSFPVYQNAFSNIKVIIENGIENNSIGVINSCWGDFGSETFRELNYWGYAWSAQCSWSYNKSNAGAFSINFFNDYFQEKDEGFYNVFVNLSFPLNQIYYYDLWQHPLLKFRESVWWESRVSPSAKQSWMELTYQYLDKEIKRLSKKAKRNADNLKILKLTNDFNKFYGEKIEFQKEFEKVALGYRDELDLKKISFLATNCIAKLRLLKKDYEELWLRYYKKDNLEMILEDKFDRLIQYFEESLEKLKIYEKEKRFDIFDPTIKSEWIASSDSLANKAVFVKKIKFDTLPSRVILQLIGESRAIIYLNGEKLEETFARRSLSFWVERKRIKWIDITSKLKLGENEIKVEAYNYGKGRAAAFNVASNIQELNTSVENGWFELKSDGSLAKPKIYNYRAIVIEPNFQTGRKSFIERR